MLRGIRSRLTYANVMATIALFISLGGGAYAAATVGSSQVVNNSLRSIDLKDGAAVKSSDVVNESAGGGLSGQDVREGTFSQVPSAQNANRAWLAEDAETLGGHGPDYFQRRGVTTSCSAGQMVTGIGADGNVSCATDQASGGASGPAGGDLTGSYPDPQLAENAVASGEVAVNALTGSDIDESTLGEVPSATNAGTLDGRDSTAFLAPTYLRAYEGETASDGSHTIWCDPGDVATGGGGDTTNYELEDSYPVEDWGNWGWVVRSSNRATQSMIAYVICSNTNR